MNYRQYLFYLILLIFVGCATGQLSIQDVYLPALLAPNDVKKSGQILINNDFGFTRILNDSVDSPLDTLVITVHGYQSKGYEWIEAISKLVHQYKTLYFYRYDWDQCIDSTSVDLARNIDLLINSIPESDITLIFSHSYGGIILANSIQYLHANIEIEAHAIASPLAGYPSLTDTCGISDIQYKYHLDLWEPNIHFYQWRTQHHLDGAFKKLSVNPQEISSDKIMVFDLPETMDGHRLGHNWSVTWVVREYVGYVQ